MNFYHFLLKFLGFKPRLSVDAVIAPMNKIVADLKSLAETEQDIAAEKAEVVETMQAEISNCHLEANRATNLATKYMKLVA